MNGDNNAKVVVHVQLVANQKTKPVNETLFLNFRFEVIKC